MLKKMRKMSENVKKEKEKEGERKRAWTEKREQETEETVVWSVWVVP